MFNRFELHPAQITFEKIQNHHRCKCEECNKPIVLFSCGICSKHKCVYVSESTHNLHVQTESHQQFKELFKSELLKLSETTLQEKYSSIDINVIVDKNEKIFEVCQVK
jgi:hypothetical protein